MVPVHKKSDERDHVPDKQRTFIVNACQQTLKHVEVLLNYLILKKKDRLAILPYSYLCLLQ
jgi:hypothetical protein